MDQTKYTTITIDKSTASRLKELAGDSPLTRYLRELSQSLTGEIASPIEKRLANIEFKLDMWKSAVKNMTLKTDELNEKCMLTDEEVKEAYRSCATCDFITSFGNFAIEKAIAKEAITKAIPIIAEEIFKRLYERVRCEDKAFYHRRFSCEKCRQSLRTKFSEGG